MRALRCWYTLPWRHHSQSHRSSGYEACAPFPMYLRTRVRLSWSAPVLCLGLLLRLVPALASASPVELERCTTIARGFHAVPSLPRGVWLLSPRAFMYCESRSPSFLLLFGVPCPGISALIAPPHAVSPLSPLTPLNYRFGPNGHFSLAQVP